MCIHPDKNAGLLRITVSLYNGAEEVVILWRGPRTEVFEQGASSLSAIFLNFIDKEESVEVGTYHPRIPLLPLWLPAFVERAYGFVKPSDLTLRY